MSPHTLGSTSMDLVCRSNMVGAVPVLSAEGEVDLATLPVFRDHLLRHVHDHRGLRVVVDLDGVTTLDDTGLGVLLGAAAHARDLGGSLDLVCTDGRLRDRLANTRLDNVVPVHARIG